MESLNNIDKKKAAILGATTFGALLLSYFVYRKVVKEKIPETSRTRRRLRKHLKSLSRERQRIVGANKNLQNQSADANELIMVQDL